MKVTLAQLNPSVPALQQLAQKELPAKVAYRLGRVLASVDTEITQFRKTHSELIKKHGGIEDSETQQLRVPPEHLDAFLPEFEELLAVEVDVWGDGVKLDELGDISVSAAVLAQLDWLITGDPAEEAKGAGA